MPKFQIPVEPAAPAPTGGKFKKFAPAAQKDQEPFRKEVFFDLKYPEGATLEHKVVGTDPRKPSFIIGDMTYNRLTLELYTLGEGGGRVSRIAVFTEPEVDAVMEVMAAWKETIRGK